MPSSCTGAEPVLVDTGTVPGWADFLTVIDPADLRSVLADRRAHPHNVSRKARAANHANERKYGLISTAPADRTAARRPTRAEIDKLARVQRQRATQGRPSLNSRTGSSSALPSYAEPAQWSGSVQLVRHLPFGADQR